MAENISRKPITTGLDLVIIKQLSQLFIEFHVENHTSSVFFLKFAFKDLQNVIPENNQPVIKVRVLPNSVMKLSQLNIKGSFSYKYQFAYQKLNESPEIKEIEVDAGLVLRTIQVDTEQKVTFYLISQRFEQTNFELTFNELEGITVNENSVTYKIELAPKSTQKVCSLIFNGEWSYKYSYKYWYTAAPVDLVPIRQRQGQETLEFKSKLYNVDADLLSIEEVEKLLNNSRFTDPYFPPCDYSIYGTSQVQSKQDVQWARPEEFMYGTISLYQDQIGMSDIIQGELGDCWLMCALCALSGEEERIKDIIVNKETSSKSVYQISLHKNGEPVIVTIDDYFPCKPGAQPIFSRNHGSELWVLLLEKAYAKLHGSYYALKAGFASEAVIDLTGCAAGTYRLNAIENLWEKLLNWSQGGYKLVAGSGKATTRKDIVSNHYYSITRVEDIETAKIIQLRNPWGDYEWLGDWSDTSELWTPELKERLNVKFDLHDGSFWMSIDDFSSIFSQLMITNLKKEIDHRFKTIIERRNGAAKCKSFWEITVVQHGTIIIGVHQEDERCEGTKEYRRYADIGLCILKRNGNRLEFIGSTPGNQSHRDIFWEGNLDEGTYIVVLLSTGLSLRRPHDAKKRMFPLATSSSDLHPIVRSTLKDIFRKLSLNIQNSYQPKEIEEIFNREEFLPLWRHLSNSESISYKFLCNAFLSLVDEAGEKVAEGVIENWGYDEDFYSVSSKPVIISIQSETQYEVTMQELDAKMQDEAWQTYMHYEGVIKTDEDNLQIRALSHSDGCSLMAINLNSIPIKVSIDMKKATNIDSTGGLEMEFTLDPFQCNVFQHIQCQRNKDWFTYPFTYTIAYVGD